MFALIRHAGYDISSGSLTPDGVRAAHALAERLKTAGNPWSEVRTSPMPRARETAVIIAQDLGIPVVDDERVSMEGNFVDLLPPTEPNHIIFVSHLPVLTQMLRTWSKSFSLEEPPLTAESSGYVVETGARAIKPLVP